MEKVICQLLLWNEGHFRFELDDIDPQEKAEHARRWLGAFKGP